MSDVLSTDSSLVNSDVHSPKASPKGNKNNCFEAALAYHNLKWFVLPIDPVFKKPMIKWAHRKEIRPNENEIIEWFSKWPDARVGIATGELSDVDVIDIDCLEDLEVLNIIYDVPETISQTTGRAEGGKQLFFKYSGKLKNATHVNKMAVDVRTDGGIVVLPPSRHISGRCYEWGKINPIKNGTKALASLSPGLLDLLPKKNISKNNGKNSSSDQKGETRRYDRTILKEQLGRLGEAQIGETTTYGRAILKKNIERLGESQIGERNNTLNKIAFILGQFIGGGELDRAEVESELTTVAISIGLGETEVANTIQSGINAGLKVPRKCPFEDDSKLAKQSMTRTGITIKNIIDAAFRGQRGCAELFTRLNMNRFCFDHASGLWYQFFDHYWSREEIGTPIKAADELENLFKKAIANIAGEIILTGQEAKQMDKEEESVGIKSKLKNLEANQKALQKQVGALSALPYRKQVVEFSAQGPESLGISGKEWDLDPWTLACRNGLVDLKTGELKPGKPEDYIKSFCQTNYNLSARCPEFENFMDGVFAGNHDLIDFCQRVIGVALIGDAFQKQYIIILSGQGRNGKDTLVSTLGYVLGHHLAGPIAPEMLLDSGNFGRRSPSGPSPDIMRLRGLRLAWASETSQGRKFDCGMAKMLSGGGSLVGRPPYGRHEIEFQQSHLIFLLTNHRPHAPVDDYAFWKRIKNIPFQISFVDNPQSTNESKVDRKLPDKLKTEAEGILRWMVEGCLQYQRKGLNTPGEVRIANEQYRRSEDTLQDFIDEVCEISPEANCLASELYKEYKLWSIQGGIQPMSQTALGIQMKRRGFNKGKDPKTRLTIYEGIRFI